MDREYLIRTIELLKQQMNEHDIKFAGNKKHENCLPRFVSAIDKLELELASRGTRSFLEDRVK